MKTDRVQSEAPILNPTRLAGVQSKMDPAGVEDNI